MTPQKYEQEAANDPQKTQPGLEGKGGGMGVAEEEVRDMAVH